MSVTVDKIKKAAKDNSDLPVSFIKNLLISLEEKENRLVTKFVPSSQRRRESQLKDK